MVCVALTSRRNVNLGFLTLTKFLALKLILVELWCHPMTIANYLTLMRLLISPLFLLIYIAHDFFGINEHLLPYVLLILIAISELSDACDGYLARKYNQVTDLGKILDPMADSIVRTTVFLTFTLPPVSLSVWFIFVFLYRDSVVSTLRTICALRGFALAARLSGKVKAVIQALAIVCIILLLIPYSRGDLSLYTLQTISAWIVAVASLYTLFSGMDYMYSNRKYIKKLLVLPQAKKFAAKSRAYFSEVLKQQRKTMS